MLKGDPMNQREDSVKKEVRDRYAEVARSRLSNEAESVRSVAAAFGYSDDELASLPAEANMGLSCGNPTAMASLKPGEVVVDLGCGGGLDVLLAARLVGPTGKSIGIDMTTEMLDRARAGAEKVGATNVEFHQATIDELPLADNSVDCIISNCVVNLVPNKLAVFREMTRVLKPGGRVAISDIALKQELPNEIRASMDAYVGCIAGAILIGEYQRQMLDAGLSSVVVTDTAADLNAYAKAGTTDSPCCSESERVLPPASSAGACCSSSEQDAEGLHDQLANVLSKFDANEYAASVKVHAVKNPVCTPLPTENPSPTSVRIYDRPMCCATGVCGPQVDPVLPRFAGDLAWIQEQGHVVERFNLAQQPGEFAKNKTVQQVIEADGVECLPLVIVNGQIVSQSEYPSREQLANWVGSVLKQTTLPIATDSGGCCGDSGCC